MYSTCLFCTRPLGENHAIATFPVGRRLAFDAAKGRLWVVCVRCGQWNLTPLEERWEAIEQCERAFRDTRVRVSTDQVGLARLEDGTTLIRVGRPLRPEFAAWRYGDQFGRRRRDALVRLGVGGVAAGALVVGGVMTGLVTGGTVTLALYGRSLFESLAAKRRVAKLMIDGVPRAVRHGDLALARFGALHGSTVPTLELTHSGGVNRFIGPDATRVLGQLLPQTNRMGGSERQVRNAVDEIDAAGSAPAYFETVASHARQVGVNTLVDFPPEVRLALEMAAHEEAERRALDGELAELEAAWRDAEEIAAIADDLLLPSSVEQRMR